jgi:hypothetical protein
MIERLRRSRFLNMVSKDAGCKAKRVLAGLERTIV